MANLRRTMRAGHRNEQDLVELIRHLTPYVWSNIRLPTSHTVAGNTEIDILFYYHGVMHLVETKRVIKIDGEYYQKKWRLFARSGDFVALNIMTQSRLHAKVFCDRYYDKFREFPRVRSMVVVPDGTEMNESIRGEVLTFTEYYNWLCQLPVLDDSSYKYRYIAFMTWLNEL